jgi:cardiolipin synthase (CMP-forming)
VWLAVIILGRDVGLGISALWIRYSSLPPPKTVSRYWDFSLPSAEVHPTNISKVPSLLDHVNKVQYVVAIDSDWVLYDSTYPRSRHLNIYECFTVFPTQDLCGNCRYTVATTTIWSGLSYVYSKDAVKILKNEEK